MFTDLYSVKEQKLCLIYVYIENRHSYQIKTSEPHAGSEAQLDRNILFICHFNQVSEIEKGSSCLS
jgi:hypothetical protein